MSGEKTPGDKTPLETVVKADIEAVVAPTDPKQNTIKLAIDYGPLAVFVLTYVIAKFVLKMADKSEPLIWASSLLAGASVIAVIAGWLIEKRIAWIALVSAIIGIPSAIMTVVFHNTVFFKIKMTIIDALIGSVLLGGLALKKQPLKALLGEALPLKEAAWPRLTLYYALFYYAMAAANEVVWRTQSDAVYVTWKGASIIGGPILLALCLVPYLMKNMIIAETAEDKAKPGA